MECYSNGRKTCAILKDKTILISHGKKYSRIWLEESEERVDQLRETIKKDSLLPISEKEFKAIHEKQIQRLSL